MSNSLENKKILIVGGSAGIGLAVAQQAYTLGASVIIASRSASDNHSHLSATIGRDIDTYSFNINSEPKTSDMLSAIANIDHLVITARDESNSQAFIETDIKQARQAFETKFWGPYQLIQKAFKHINPQGSIVLTSGIAGEKTYRNFSTMAAINSATETLCRSLALELAPIRVNTVSPGFVRPKPHGTVKYAEQFPATRLASPDEIASAYIHLMESPYITGTTLVIDGGARLV